MKNIMVIPIKEKYYLFLTKVCSNTNNLIINKRFFPKNYFPYPTLSANPTTSLPLFVKEL